MNKDEYILENQIVTYLVRPDPIHQWTDLFQEWQSVSDMSEYKDIYTRYLDLEKDKIDNNFYAWLFTYFIKKNHIPIEQDMLTSLTANYYDIKNRTPEDEKEVEIMLEPRGNRIPEFVKKKEKEFLLIQGLIEKRMELLRTQAIIVARSNTKILDIEDSKEPFHMFDQVICTSEEKRSEFRRYINIKELQENIPYDIKENDLFYMFDTIRLTDHVPFCNYRTFYKFIEYAPLQKFMKEKEDKDTDDIMNMYILYHDFYYKCKIKHDMIIVNNPEIGKEIIPTDLIDMINQHLGLDIQSDPNHQHKLKANTYIEWKSEEPMNIKLLLYYLCTHPIYNTFLFVDESRKLKSSDNIQFFYHPHYSDEKFYISFRLKNISKDEIASIKMNDHERLNSFILHHAIHINIIKCPNLRYLYETINLISTILYDFQVHSQTLKNQYGSIPIPPVEKYKLKDKKNTRRPDVGPIRSQQHFPGNLNKMIEDPVFFDELQKNIDDYYFTEIPPRTLIKIGNKEIQIRDNKPGENKPQILFFKQTNEYYICNREKDHPYIKIKTISYKDKNEEEKEIDVPACYSKLKTGDKKNAASTYVLDTGKKLDPRQKGSVQAWINRWYQLVDPIFTLERMGISNDNNSILYAIEFAISGKEKSKAELDRLKEILIKKLKVQYRMVLTEHPYLKKEELIEQFTNGYIDPKLFYSFLCHHYQKTLVLFDKNGTKTEDYFYLSHPYYKRHFTNDIHYPDMIFICINQGQEFSYSKHPPCELIYRKKEENEYVLSDRVLYHHVQEHLSLMYQKQYHTVPYAPISQSVDSLGYVSFIHIDQGTVFILDPLHSLPCKTNNKVDCWDEKQIDVFFADKNEKDTVEEYYYSGYRGYKFEKNKRSYFLPIERNEHDSLLEKYQSFEKIARYLIQYTIYLFSHYCKNKGITSFKNEQGILYSEEDIEAKADEDKLQEEDDSDKEEEEKDDSDERADIYSMIVQFVDEYSEINEAHQYAKVSRKLDLQSIEFIKNGKLQYTSELLRKKAIYSLLQEYKKSPLLFFNYANEPFMRNYFLSAVDFTTYPMHQIVEYNEVSQFEHFIQSRNDNNYPIFNSIQIQKGPYFLSLLIKECKHSFFLMQPISSIAHGINVYEKWVEKRMNIGWNTENMKEHTHPHIHQLIWNNPIQYEYIPTIHPHSPFFSILKEKEQYLLQVMLPM